MKKIKVFWNGERLKDVYPHATAWQVLKFRVLKFNSFLLNLTKTATIIYVSFIVGQYFAPVSVYSIVNKPDSLTEKVAELKSELLAELKQCESSGKEGLIVFDSNKVASLGYYQYQVATVQHYYKVLYGKEIGRKEAIEIAFDDTKASDLTEDIIFKDKKGWRNWYNCGTKLNFAQKVEFINKLQK